VIEESSLYHKPKKVTMKMELPKTSPAFQGIFAFNYMIQLKKSDFSRFPYPYLPFGLALQVFIITSFHRVKK